MKIRVYLKTLYIFLSVIFILSGCSGPGNNQIDSSVEYALKRAVTFSGPLRITWYISPDLKKNPDLINIDLWLSEFIKTLNSQNRHPDISVSVKYNIDRSINPELIIPVDSSWSAMALDFRDRRIIIPDVFDPVYFPMDFSRALDDLAEGSVSGVGFFCSDQNKNSVFTVLSQLTGRWRTAEWDGLSGSVNNFKVIVVYDDFSRDPGMEITDTLSSFAASGGGVIVVSGKNSRMSSIGQWARQWRQRSELLGSVIYINDYRFLDLNTYMQGLLSFRELDAALLAVSGRTDILSVLNYSLPDDSSSGRNIHISVLTDFIKKRKTAGSRILKASAKTKDRYSADRKPDFPDRDSIDKITFSDSETGVNIFSLVKKNNDWVMISENWNLPVLQKRVKAFLDNIYSSLPELWAAGTADGKIDSGFVTVEFFSDGGKSVPVVFTGERKAGGGVYSESADKKYLWPYLSAEEISGNSVYWMNTRLFPENIHLIRCELKTPEKVYWRILEENDGWYYFKASDGFKKIKVNTSEAENFLERIVNINSILTADSEGEKCSTGLILSAEDSSGRNYSFCLKDLSGNVSGAVSDEGIIYVLPDETVKLFLYGLNCNYE